MAILEHEYLWSDQIESGWSLSWYGVRDGAVDCSHLFAPDQLHLVFNLSGQGIVLGDRTRIGISAATISMCFPRQGVKASRLTGGGNHEFVILSMKSKWLKRILGDRSDGVYDALWQSVSADASVVKPVGHVRAMTIAEKDMARQLSDPPVEGDALGFWYTAKVMEVLALHLFRPGDLPKQETEEPFCLSRKRILNDRVSMVNEWLEEYLDEALDLKRLAAHVGCAPHYLSRLFSKEVGKTISQQLRSMRVEKAAELMNSGRFNVTEAAFEVGYNSLSHFTKAFTVEKGVKPSDYLAKAS